jgi:hypothetical protein
MYDERDGGDCSFIWENYYDPEEEINEYDLTIFVQEEGDTFHRFTETHLQRGYTVGQMRTLVEQSGLKILEIMDSDTGEAVTETSERVYIVAKEQQKRPDSWKRYFWWDFPWTRTAVCTMKPPACLTVLSLFINTPSPTTEGTCSDTAK